jgi:Uma2 family endonuclease
MTTAEQRRLAKAEGHFVVRAVDWPNYRAFADALGERHVRLAYDGENLELMTVSRLHERLSRLLGRFLVVLTEELKLPLDSAGSTTLEREDVARAIESDECFYITNEPLVRDRDELDLTTDPPPDLGVEIDISRSSLNRLAIYAELRIPEVWRYDGDRLRIYSLREKDGYDEVARSRYFPKLNLADLEAFLRRRGEMEPNNLVSEFRGWVRDQIARGWPQSS